MTEAPLLGKDRIEALTDGIFAVAMTLLVLDVKLPIEPADLDGPGLRAALVALLSKFESYVVSFAVLCVFWLGHHRLMHQVKQVDHGFLWLNLLFILFITFVPFATSLMGAYRDLDDVAVIYGVNLAAILGMQCLMWHRAILRLREPPGESTALWRIVRNRYLLAFGVVALALALALFDIAFAIYIYLLLIVLGMFRPKPIPDGAARSG
jgi:uncharacterized membrane protein